MFKGPVAMDDVPHLGNVLALEIQLLINKYLPMHEMHVKPRKVENILKFYLRRYIPHFECTHLVSPVEPRSP
jgi:hypothetical protein